MFQSDLEELVGPRPFEQLTSYQEFIKGETEKKRQDAKDERELAETVKRAAKKPAVAKAESATEPVVKKKPAPRKKSPKKED